MNSEWHNVSVRHPCPVCGHDSWCSVSNDGRVCVCRRKESDRPTKSGIGWIHSLEDGEVAPYTPPKRPEVKGPDIAEYFSKLPAGDLQIKACRRLAMRLGVDSMPLQLLDMRWDAGAKAVAFPMRDAEGHVTGIRYRDPITGRKWSRLGSKDGLFYAPSYIGGEFIVCEGPSDCAAAMSCVIQAVGRSACLTGAKAVRELLHRMQQRDLTIVADNDPPKPSPTGGTWCPGYDGAKRLAEQLDVPVRIVLPPPPYKDLREWYSRGAMTREKFEEVANNATWIVPKTDNERMLTQ